MTYLKYNDYTSSGGTCSAVDFERYELMCRKQIDYYTSGRISADAVFYGDISSVPYYQGLRGLTFELVAVFSAQDISKKVVTGAANGSYSESYRTISPTEVTFAAGKLIRQYLSDCADHNGVSLLYRGA